MARQTTRTYSVVATHTIDGHRQMVFVAHTHAGGPCPHGLAHPKAANCTDPKDCALRMMGEWDVDPYEVHFVENTFRDTPGTARFNRKVDFAVRSELGLIQA